MKHGLVERKTRETEVSVVDSFVSAQRNKYEYKVPRGFVC